jgi:asparagine synthase (glutamine-hydrolysing)
LCGFVGFVNFKKDISNDKFILENMNNTLSQRGPDEEGYYIKEHIALRS